MEKKEIIKLFLQNGFQLSGSALSAVSSDPRAIITELKKIKPRPFIVTDEYIKKNLNISSFKSISIKMIKKFTFKKDPLHVDDYIKHLLSRYEKIKSILIGQMAPKKLVSINKITSKTMKFSIIGLVKERDSNSITIEDSTGETNLYFDENMKEELNNILLDDVIGVQCEKREEKYYVRKLIYPDVLSSRNVTRTKGEMLISFLVSTQDLTNTQTKKLTDYFSGIKNLSTVFVFGHVKSHFFKPPPTQLNLIQLPLEPIPKLFQLDAIKILTIPHTFFNHHSKSFSVPEVFTSMLKRRELIIGAPHIPNAYEGFILDEVPDIIVSNHGQSTYLNYKGTTIISNSDPKKVFTVNLKTRDVQQITL